MVYLTPASRPPERERQIKGTCVRHYKRNHSFHWNFRKWPWVACCLRLTWLNPGTRSSFWNFQPVHTTVLTAGGVEPFHRIPTTCICRGKPGHVKTSITTGDLRPSNIYIWRKQEACVVVTIQVLLTCLTAHSGVIISVACTIAFNRFGKKTGLFLMYCWYFSIGVVSFEQPQQFNSLQKKRAVSFTGDQEILSYLPSIWGPEVGRYEKPIWSCGRGAWQTVRWCCPAGWGEHWVGSLALPGAATLHLTHFLE